MTSICPSRLICSTVKKLMNDDERDFLRDPASLLPFVCELMPANPDAVQIANSKKYIGEKATDGDG
jgi:hypothetical protein